MPKPTLVTPTLTINVPPSGPLRAIISPAMSPISPTRTRRQQAARTKALRPRPGGRFLQVPTEASTATTDVLADEDASPFQRGLSTARTEETNGPKTADSRNEPQLADNDILEIHEFLDRKNWIQEKIKVGAIFLLQRRCVAD